jgi:predicted nucleic acid-binding Zn ribbon protein
MELIMPKQCPECGNKIGSNSDNCHRCAAHKRDKRDFQMIVPVVLIIVCLLVLLSLFPDKSPVYDSALHSTDAPQIPAPRPSTSSSAVHHTKSGCVACFSLDSLTTFAYIAVQKDAVAARKMFLSGECVSYPPGIEVYIIESDYIHVKIRPKGTTDILWTVRDLVD